MMASAIFQEESMRKVLIVLLSSLLLFSFASCEKDKSEEIAQTFVDFVDSVNLLQDLYDSFDDVIISDTDYNTTPIDLSKSTAQPAFSSSFLKRYITIEDKQKIDVTKVESKGTISGTTEDKEDITFTDTSFTITYNVLSAEDKVVEEGKKLTLTLSGNYYAVEKDHTYTVTISMTLNGTEYAASMVTDYSSNSVTEATVNGKDVNLTLVNHLFEYK